MEEEGYQRDLFNLEKPRRPFARFFNIFPKMDLEGTFAVTLKLDRIIFISIGLIMMMVVVFALGVERGRARTLEPAPNTAVAKPVAVIKPAAQAVIAKPVLAPQAVAVRPQAVPVTASKPFTIVAAAFGQKETAESESAKLKRNGFDSFVVYSEPYYIVCVGGFADRSGTQTLKTLNTVRRLYKDAYLKMR